MLRPGSRIAFSLPCAADFTPSPSFRPLVVDEPIIPFDPSQAARTALESGFDHADVRQCAGCGPKRLCQVGSGFLDSCHLGYRRAVSVAMFAKPPTEIAPGAVHLPGWLSTGKQRRLVVACREWALPPAGMRATRLPNGAVMSVRTVCLGWHWYPYRYSRTVDDGDGSRVKPFPDWLGDLGRQAVAAAYGDSAASLRYQPDIALINYYDRAARMGMHQDRDERSPAPVVSLSLGDSCVFRFGNTESRGRPWRDVVLESGDVIVFGGPSRFAFHGVPKTLPAATELGIGLRGGRLNITLRESGL